MAGVPAKLPAAVIVLRGLGGLLADLHCDSLESLSWQVMLLGNIITMSFTGSRDHTVCSPLRSDSLNSIIQTNHFN